MHITASVFIDDDAGLWAARTSAPVSTPVPDMGTGACRKQAWPTPPEAGSTNRLHVAGHVPGSAAMVAMTEGRPGGHPRGGFQLSMRMGNRHNTDLTSLLPLDIILWMYSTHNYRL